MVYDAFARASPNQTSLNECINPAPPPLRDRLWDVLVRQQVYPVEVSGDIRQAFLQIRVREFERDALRFHWRAHEENEVEISFYASSIWTYTFPVSPECLS